MWRCTEEASPEELKFDAIVGALEEIIMGAPPASPLSRNGPATSWRCVPLCVLPGIAAAGVLWGAQHALAEQGADSAAAASRLRLPEPGATGPEMHMAATQSCAID